jgi:hypothetical protein
MKTRLFIGLPAFCTLILLGLYGGSLFASDSSYAVHNSLGRLNGKPADIGGSPVNVIYQWQGYGGTRLPVRDYSGPPPYDYLSGKGYTEQNGIYYKDIGYPDDVKLDRNYSGIISIDFEVWPAFDIATDWSQAKSGQITSPSNKMLTTKKYILDSIAAVRQAFPNASISFYNLGGIGIVVSGLPGVSEDFLVGWRAVNDWYKPVFDAIDFCSPSIYYSSTKGDRKTPLSFDDYLIKSGLIMTEMQRVCQGKPIIPFISPFIMDKYPDSVTGLITLVPMVDWERQLQSFKGKVDGVIVWSKNVPESPWLDVAPYWNYAISISSLQMPTIRIKFGPTL